MATIVTEHSVQGFSVLWFQLNSTHCWPFPVPISAISATITPIKSIISAFPGLLFNEFQLSIGMLNKKYMGSGCVCWLHACWCPGPCSHQALSQACYSLNQTSVFKKNHQNPECGIWRKLYYQNYNDICASWNPKSVNSHRVKMTTNCYLIWQYHNIVWWYMYIYMYICYQWLNVITCSGIGLSFQFKYITWTSDDILLIKSSGTHFSKFWIKICWGNNEIRK